MADNITLNAGSGGDTLAAIDDGTAKHQTNINKDPASDHKAHVSHFGVLKAGPTIPVIKGNFPGSALDDVQWEEITINSASVTIANGTAQMASGTNTAGSTKLISRQAGRFEADQVTVFQSGVRAGTGQASNTRIWGVMSYDEQNGLYFKWNGTTFQVVSKRGGTETAVNSGSFSGDSSFEPADTNTTYRIEYSAGRAIFYSASGGKKNLLHEMVDTALPLVADLDLHLYYENTNSGNTTDKSMYVRGSSSSVWGSLDRYNVGGAHLVADFDTEVALGRVSRYEISTKFGRNPDIDTGTAEDIWANGGDYTGFNATANENIEVLSSDVDDQGSVVSSGTATGGTRTTLVDSGATFTTDGVAVGDVILNDTQAMHGIVTAVDSQTQLTVWRMMSGDPAERRRNLSGDSYRVVNANDTGAAVVRLDHLLNADYEEQTSKYVVLNGTTGVTVTGNYMRCSRASIILAGTTGGNEGTITVRQATTTANVFAAIPVGANQTAIAAFTVPTGKILILRRLRVGITRASGTAGSAQISFRCRNRGEVFRTIRPFEVQTGDAVEFTALGGDIIAPGADIKFRVDSVSDNNTIADGAFEYSLFEED